MSALNKGFSVELVKKEHLAEVIISDDPRRKVLISGYIGQVLGITLVEEMVLELHCSYGDLRIDIGLDELTEFISKVQGDPEVEKK